MKHDKSFSQFSTLLYRYFRNFLFIKLLRSFQKKKNFISPPVATIKEPRIYFWFIENQKKSHPTTLQEHVFTMKMQNKMLKASVHGGSSFFTSMFSRVSNWLFFKRQNRLQNRQINFTTLFPPIRKKRKEGSAGTKKGKKVVVEIGKMSRDSTGSRSSRIDRVNLAAVLEIPSIDLHERGDTEN